VIFVSDCGLETVLLLPTATFPCPVLMLVVVILVLLTLVILVFVVVVVVVVMIYVLGGLLNNPTVFFTKLVNGLVTALNAFFKKPKFLLVDGFSNNVDCLCFIS
jgi:hypothetical protein